MGSQSISYFAYANVAPVAPAIKGTNLTTRSSPVVLLTVDGVAAGSGYLQFFDQASTTVTGGTVPLKSVKVSAAGPLPSMFGTLSGVTFYTGMIIAFSSTETTYTAVATAFDVWGEIDQYELPPAEFNTLTTVGDQSTSVQQRTIWANGGTTEGLHTLLEVVVNNNDLSDVYMMIFCHASADNDVSPYPTVVIPTSTSKVLRYNLIPHAKTSTGTLRDGCYIVISDDATKRVLTLNDMTIQARYY